MTTKRMLGAVVALLLSTSIAGPASAQQGEWLWDFQYSTVLGAGDTGDFAGDFSWRGLTLGVQRVLGPGLSVGLQSGWHVMDEETSGTTQFPGGAITGTAFRYVNAVPVLLTGDYHIATRGEFRPFVGAGVGTYWIQNRTEAGVLAVEDDNWHFGLMGEAGLAWVRPNDVAFTLTARYNHGFESDGIERPYWTFSVGYRVGV